MLIKFVIKVRSNFFFKNLKFLVHFIKLFYFTIIRPYLYYYEDKNTCIYTLYQNYSS